MTSHDKQLRFGAFLSPIHAVDEDPTLALHRDVELVQHLDWLGLDEVWVGEHHSTGWEFISSPEVFLAYVAGLTKRIRLGTGVVSLPYHNPFMVAERIVLLDHLTRGRAIFGVGPGSLPYDAIQLGIDPADMRPNMEVALEVILDLLAGKEVTCKTDWFTLENARLQLLPYQGDELEVAVTATFSPNGAKLAGRLGTSMLSLTATQTQGSNTLANHWSVVEQESAEHGHLPSRSTWRMVGPMHLAETEEQARKDVATGVRKWVYYMKSLSSLSVVPDNATVEEVVDGLVDSGFAVIGTPEQAIAQIEDLWARSGGFGTYLLWAHDWAGRTATLQSYELFARHVVPAFQSRVTSLDAEEKRALSLRSELMPKAVAARQKAADDYAKERGESSS